MRTRLLLATLTAALVAGSLGAASASAQTPAATVWLCKPGLASNPCTSSTKTTLIKPNGAKVAEPLKAQAKQPIDCFYVYPTVSQQTTANSNLEITAAETGVATAQASRFSSKCRVYAPMYRQLTLAALFGRATGTADRALAYNDVKAAWNEYLAKYNKGRGVVLIGHSQGSYQLTELITNEIDQKAAVRKKIVSALLIGGQVLVAKGKDLGGSFEKMPACRKADQTACVVGYNTFSQQPPADSRFGRTAQPGKEVLCVNPAALKRGAKERQRASSQPHSSLSAARRWHQRLGSPPTTFTRQAAPAATARTGFRRPISAGLTTSGHDLVRHLAKHGAFTSSTSTSSSATCWSSSTTSQQPGASCKPGARALTSSLAAPLS
ncbi:MAG: DUF3089 domain-containing protein [Solirubrobacterales bacterium]|nr:DUF3089 domain-containing protein [Solirubrobacterales bacterium]